MLAAVLKTVLPTKLKDLPRLNANGNKIKSSELCTEGCCPEPKAAGSDACAAHAHLQNCCSKDSCTEARVDGRGYCGTCCFRQGCKNKRGDGTTAYCDGCAAARNAVCIRQRCKNKRGDGTTAYCDGCVSARNAVCIRQGCKNKRGDGTTAYCDGCAATRKDAVCSTKHCKETRGKGNGTYCDGCAAARNAVCIRHMCKNKRGDGTTAYCDRCAAARNAVAKFFTTHTPAVQGHSRIRDIMVAYESGGGIVPSTQTQPQHGQGRTRALLHLLAECHSANLGKEFPTGCALPGPFPFPETPGLFYPITFTGVTVYDDSGNVIQGFSKETVTAKAPETSSGGGVTGGGAATSGGGASVATPAWKEYRVKTGKDKGKLYYQQGAGATTWKRPDCLCPPRPPPPPSQ